MARVSDEGKVTIMTKIEKLLKKHKREIIGLRNTCNHPENKITDWIIVEWAPGHDCGEARVCRECGKTIESRNFNKESKK